MRPAAPRRPTLALLAAVAGASSACATRATDVSPPPPLDAATTDASDAGDGPAPPPPCALGGTETGLPVTIACGQGAMGRLVLAGDEVYWAVQAQRPGPAVMQAPLVGGAASSLADATSPAVGLVVVPPFAYYTLFVAGAVMRVRLEGGLPETVTAGLDRPALIASDGAALYVTGGHDHAGYVLRVPLGADAGAPDVLMDGLSRPRGVAVDGGFVYWADFLDGALLRTAEHLPPSVADGGVRTASRLAAGLSGPSDLVIAAGHAYLADQRGMIVRVPLAGGDPEIVAPTRGVPYGVAADATSIYWTTLVDGGVFRAPLAPGGPVATLATGEFDPHFIAVGDDAVYWGAWGNGGAVKRVAKNAVARPSPSDAGAE